MCMNLSFLFISYEIPVKRRFMIRAYVTDIYYTLN